MKRKGENRTLDLLNSCRCCVCRKTDVNKRFGFSSLPWCLATWRREPSASPRNSNVSICPPRGPGTCRRAALRRYISLLRLPGKSPRLFCVNPPQILQCYCVLRPPPFAPREYRPHYSCLHVKKKKGQPRQQRSRCKRRPLTFYISAVATSLHRWRESIHRQKCYNIDPKAE